MVSVSTGARATSGTPAAVGAALAITAAAFWPTLLTFHGVWVGYVYSHGYVVLLITAGLLWRHRLAVTEDSGGWEPAFVALLPLSLVWFFATVLNVQTAQQAAVPALLVCWAIAVWGLRSARALVPIAVIFFMVVPVWGVLVRPLQAATIFVAGVAVRVLGISAEIDGEFITVQAGTFQIAGSCSGLNYLMVGLLLGALYGHFFAQRWQTRLLVVGAAALVSIVGNWIRVSGLVVIGNATDMQSSLMDEHGAYGWVIFTLGLPVFFLLARRLSMRDDGLPRGTEGQDGAAPFANADLSGDTEIAAPSAKADLSGDTEIAGRRAMGRRAILASGLGLLGPVAYFALGALPITPPAEPGLPEADRGWVQQGASARPWGWTPAYAGATERITSEWTDGESTVVFDRLVYLRQTQGSELVNELNAIAADSLLVGERDLGPLGTPVRNVREAALRSDDGRVRVWYWYRVGGLNTASSAIAKWLELPAFIQRNQVSELVAISTSCADDECLAGGEALLSFLETGVGR